MMSGSKEIDENKPEARENVKDKLLFVHHSRISIRTKYHYSIMKSQENIINF